MFKLMKEDAFYKREVKVNVPLEGGGNETCSCTVHFKLLPTSRLRDFLSGAGDAGMSDFQILSEVVGGWDGIADANGEPLAMNQTNLERLADIRCWASAVFDAYIDFAAGNAEKN